MFAQGFRVIRTYDLHHPFAENTLKAIREIKQTDSNFEMYVMLGAWIQCKDAFTENPIHEEEDFEGNKFEITEAVRLAQEYPDIVKIIAVGNEAMVHWAWSYHVPPKFVLKWVKYLQELKASGDLNDDLWVTSSDNFASNIFSGTPRPNHNHQHISLNKLTGGYRKRLSIFRTGSQNVTKMPENAVHKLFAPRPRPRINLLGRWEPKPSLQHIYNQN